MIVIGDVVLSSKGKIDQESQTVRRHVVLPIITTRHRTTVRSGRETKRAA